MSNVSTIEREPKPIEVLRHQLVRMEPQIKLALPAHIPMERFGRVFMTAVQNSPKLMRCTRESLWNACMRAAQDGLLPDGREGAIVPYNEDDDGTKANIARWMPMIGGIRKKARNSGELADWYAYVVHGGDKFDFQLGDKPYVKHKPVPRSQRTADLPHGGIIAAYSIAVGKDGTRFAPEVMWIEDIEEVRSKAKSKRGPWSDPIFYPEMCRKTVARRHSKSLPMSSDLDDLIRRDDDLYDLNGARAEAVARIGGRPQSLAGALDNLARIPAPASQPAADDDQASDQRDERSDDAGSSDPATSAAPAPTPSKGPGAANRPDRIDLELELKQACTGREVLQFLMGNAERIGKLGKEDRRLFDNAVLKHQDDLKKAAKD